MRALRLENFPEVTVSCFSAELFEAFLTLFDANKLTEIPSIFGVTPVYEICYQDRRFAFFKSRMGAPVCAALYEELMAIGSKRFLLCRR